MEIGVYIWGIRKGFRPNEALYPVQATLSPNEALTYNEVAVHFNEQKDTLFRQSDKSFYYLTKDSVNHLYSFVLTSHQDIAGRQSYLVFTISCPINYQINGDLLTAFSGLLKLYKTKNADYTLQINKFTKQQVESEIAHLNLERRIPIVSRIQNIIIEFDNIAQLENINNYMGKNVFILPANSNQNMRRALVGFAYDSISKIERENSMRLENVTRLKAILSTLDNSSFVEAERLYNLCKGYIDSSTSQKFVEWQKNRNDSLTLNNLLKEFNKELQLAIQAHYNHNSARAEEILQQNKEIIKSLTPENQEKTKLWFEKYRNHQKELFLLEIKNILKKAKESLWQLDPIAYKNVVVKRRDIEIPKEIKEEHEHWKNTYRESSKNRILEQCKELAQKIKSSSRSEISEKAHEWLNTVKMIEANVQYLSPEEKKLFESNKDFKFLSAKKWIPKKGKPWLKTILLVTLILAIIGGTLFYFFQPKQSVPRSVNTRIITVTKGKDTTVIGNTTRTKSDSAVNNNLDNDQQGDTTSNSKGFSKGKGTNLIANEWDTFFLQFIKNNGKVKTSIIERKRDTIKTNRDKLPGTKAGKDAKQKVLEYWTRIRQ